MQIVPDFYNKLKNELMETYFPTVKYYRDNENSTRMSYAVELFNNGCLTFDKLVSKVANETKDTIENIKTIVLKYIEISEFTEVIFRKFKEGDVIAIFPYLEGSRGFCTTYMHVGQHSDADYTYLVSITKLASVEDYTPLKNELEKSVGYNLKIITKKNRKK